MTPVMSRWQTSTILGGLPHGLLIESDQALHPVHMLGEPGAV
jgi:hypothetical protein